MHYILSPALLQIHSTMDWGEWILKLISVYFLGHEKVQCIKNISVSSYDMYGYMYCFVIFFVQLENWCKTSKVNYLHVIKCAWWTSIVFDIKKVLCHEGWATRRHGTKVQTFILTVQYWIPCLTNMNFSLSKEEGGLQVFSGTS